MREVAVRRLALRVPPGRLAASRQRAEDALFLSAPDETRLVILRRLELGRLRADAGVVAWTDRAARRLAERRARAVHGGEPGAEAAEAVWFRSADEARRLLLRLLAAGRLPSAWFWALAVPDWQGRALAPWLATWTRAADSDAATAVALARAVIAAVGEGHAPAILAALAVLPSPPGEMPHAQAAPAALPQPPRFWTEADAIAIVRRHDGAMRGALRRALARAPPEAAQVRRLAHFAVLAVAPELAAQAPLAADLARAVARVLRDPVVALPGRRAGEEGSIGDAPRTPAPATAPLAPPAELEVRHRLPAQPSDRPAPARQREAAPRPTPPPAPHADAEPAGVPGTAGAEQLSQGAGLLLAIRALDRLGLGAWCDARPRAAAEGFGRQLLCHIAGRARLPAEDCLFALLRPAEAAQDEDALAAWRIGLDRWLRRRARRRLADLARRPGWLLRIDDVLLVRFAVQAADLRLRRLALDTDPGWVSWLGLSVRYHFSDTALA